MCGDTIDDMDYEYVDKHIRELETVITKLEDRIRHLENAIEKKNK